MARLYVCPVCSETWGRTACGGLVRSLSKPRGAWHPIGDPVGCPGCQPVESDGRLHPAPSGDPGPARWRWVPHLSRQVPVYVTSARTGRERMYLVHRVLHRARNGRLYVHYAGSTFWVADSGRYYVSTGFRGVVGEEHLLPEEEQAAEGEHGAEVTRA